MNGRPNGDRSDMVASNAPPTFASVWKNTGVAAVPLLLLNGLVNVLVTAVGAAMDNFVRRHRTSCDDSAEGSAH